MKAIGAIDLNGQPRPVGQIYAHRINGSELGLKEIECGKIIAIEKLDECPSRLRKPSISRGAGTEIFLPEQGHACTEPLDFGTSIVGRTIIYDDNLFRWPGLTQYAINRLPDEMRPVVGGNDDGNTGQRRAQNNSSN
jgi:hypothetical protein